MTLDLIKIVLIAFLFSIPISVIRSQTILNIESKRIVNDTIGWAGSAKAGFNYTQNTSTQFNFSANAHMQYKNKKELYLLYLSTSFLQADKTNFVNAGTAHIRYNRKLNPWLRWEIFSQAQYNKILNVENRFLIGSGPRFKLTKDGKFKSYVGLLYIYELENLIHPKLEEKNHRLSNYFSFNWDASENFNLSATTYYQPLLSNFSDNRLSTQMEMAMKITKNLSFSMTGNYLYDSKPPLGIPSNVFTVKNGLIFEF